MFTIHKKKDRRRKNQRVVSKNKINEKYEKNVRDPKVQKKERFQNIKCKLFARKKKKIHFMGDDDISR